MPAGQPFTSLCQQLARPATASRVDLHLHTTASDGTYTSPQVVDLACRSGLSAIAITDHDVLDGIEPARCAAAGRLEVIAGVEISAEFHGKELHLLGYFFDPNNEALQTALAKLRRHRSERFQEMVERLRTQGVPLEDALPSGTPTTVALGRRHLAEMLVKEGRAGNIRQAFFRYLGDRGRVAVPKRNLPVAEAISVLRAAGGVASWAHPSYDCTETALQELRGLGMQAIEAEFPSCRPGRRRELRELASRLNLAVTGGSDCHGPGLPRRAVGACGLSAQEYKRLKEKASGAA
jgi:predicted metal-dependent phosphoesterase TrpH